MFENLENNIYYEFFPNKKELEKIEERKKIEESEVKLIDDLFNNTTNNSSNNIDNTTNNTNNTNNSSNNIDNTNNKI
jgi:hypothetical protein